MKVGESPTRANIDNVPHTMCLAPPPLSRNVIEPHASIFRRGGQSSCTHSLHLWAWLLRHVQAKALLASYALARKFIVRRKASCGGNSGSARKQVSKEELTHEKANTIPNAQVKMNTTKMDAA